MRSVNKLHDKVRLLFQKSIQFSNIYIGYYLFVYLLTLLVFAHWNNKLNVLIVAVFDFLERIVNMCSEEHPPVRLECKRL